MNLEQEKLLRFLRDGHASMLIYAMKDGFEWANVVDNQIVFDEALEKLIQDITNNKGPSFDELEIFTQIMEWKKVVWMEGSLG